MLRITGTKYQEIYNWSPKIMYHYAIVQSQMWAWANVLLNEADRSPIRTIQLTPSGMT